MITIIFTQNRINIHLNYAAPILGVADLRRIQIPTFPYSLGNCGTFLECKATNLSFPRNAEFKNECN